jgi:hypothetical protein
MKRGKWLKLPGLINETTKISPIKLNSLREKPCFVFPEKHFYFFIYVKGTVFIFSFCGVGSLHILQVQVLIKIGTVPVPMLYYETSFPQYKA